MFVCFTKWKSPLERAWKPESRHVAPRWGPAESVSKVRWCKEDETSCPPPYPADNTLLVSLCLTHLTQLLGSFSPCRWWGALRECLSGEQREMWSALISNVIMRSSAHLAHQVSSLVFLHLYSRLSLLFPLPPFPLFSCHPGLFSSFWCFCNKNRSFTTSATTTASATWSSSYPHDCQLLLVLKKRAAAALEWYDVMWRLCYTPARNLTQLYFESWTCSSALTLRVQGCCETKEMTQRSPVPCISCERAHTRPLKCCQTASAGSDNLSPPASSGWSMLFRDHARVTVLEDWRANLKPARFVLQLLCVPAAAPLLQTGDCGWLLQLLSHREHTGYCLQCSSSRKKKGSCCFGD